MISDEGPQATPSLVMFSRSVELRVSAGVQSVVTSLKKAEEKGELLKHVKDLVLKATGKCCSGQRTYQFGSPIENMFVKEEGCSRISTAGRRTNDRRPLALLGASEPRENHSFARLAQSQYFLDSSKQFLVVLLRVEIQRLSQSSLSTKNGEMRVSLVIRPYNTISTAWELDAIEGQQEGDTIWVAARSAVATLAMAPSLEDQYLSISARVADGHSQCFGEFAMSALLQRAFSGELVTKNGVEYGRTLFRSVHFVAEGRNVQSIHRNRGNSEGLTIEPTSIQTREDLALFSLPVSCRTDLATSVAQLQAGIDDDANVRGTMHISPSSLRLLDKFLILLEKETHTSREIAAREDTFGYTLPDIKQILEAQYATDICLGVMEESYLESWG